MGAGMIRLISLTAITLALTISLITITDYSNGKSSSSSMNINEYSSWSSKEYFEQEEIKVMPFKRRRQASRFLAENKKDKKSNSRASDHCKKDNEICGLAEAGGTNSTCCNNKCMDLSSDKDNCGACKNKCVYTDTCCRGECVNINYDKRHCGKCNNRCMPGGFCIYGLCDYA